MAKAKQKREEQILKGRDWSGLFKEYEKEGDRAAALLITNALDVGLAELLRAFFIDREEVCR